MTSSKGVNSHALPPRSSLKADCNKQNHCVKPFTNIALFLKLTNHSSNHLLDLNSG